MKATIGTPGAVDDLPEQTPPITAGQDGTIRVEGNAVGPREIAGRFALLHAMFRELCFRHSPTEGARWSW